MSHNGPELKIDFTPNSESIFIGGEDASSPVRNIAEYVLQNQGMRHPLTVVERALEQSTLRRLDGTKAEKAEIAAEQEQGELVTVANCHGYTATASEMLDIIGHPHRIVTINGHSTIFAKGDTDKITLADFYLPEVTQPIDGILSPLNQSDPENAGQHQWIDTTRLIIPGKSDQEVMQKYPWVSVATTLRTGRDRDIIKNRLVIATTYPNNTIGRHVLGKLAEYQFTPRKGVDNLAKAAILIADMDGNFPYIDMRTKEHRHVRKCVRALAQDQGYDQAKDALESYRNSLQDIKDSRALVVVGDILRDLYTQYGKESDRDEALKLYEAAKASPKSFRNEISGKINAVTA